MKTWSLRSNIVTRQVSFNRTKIGGKCDILRNFQPMCTHAESGAARIFPRLGLAMIYITCINRLLPHFLICQQTMHYGQRLYRLTSKKFCRFISSLVADEWTMTNKVLNWVKSIWTNKSVEPTFFLFALAQGFYLIVAKNLYIDKVSIKFWQM